MTIELRPLEPVAEPGDVWSALGQSAYEQWIMIAKQKDARFIASWGNLDETQKYAWCASAKIVMLRAVDEYWRLNEKLKACEDEVRLLKIVLEDKKKSGASYLEEKKLLMSRIETQGQNIKALQSCVKTLEDSQRATAAKVKRRTKVKQ